MNFIKKYFIEVTSASKNREIAFKFKDFFKFHFVNTQLGHIITNYPFEVFNFKISKQSEQSYCIEYTIGSSYLTESEIYELNILLLKEFLSK